MFQANYEVVSINRCLNSSLKFYGLSAFGVIVGGLAMFFIWMIFSMPFGIIASMPSYVAGASVGMMWHKGVLQKIIYWHLPISRAIGGKYLPPSYNRRYM